MSLVPTKQIGAYLRKMVIDGYMATARNHSISSTLNKAVEYICNPEKTDEKVKHLARHFIQSFAPGEIAP